MNKLDLSRDIEHHKLSNVLRIFLIVFFFFVLLEITLQIRSHIKYGQSIFNLIANETRYVVNHNTGLLTLRPNKTFRGNESELVTNSEGLRHSEVNLTRPKNSTRLVFIGASSVMGAYAKTNHHTSSALLQQKLAKLYPGRQVEVINAGIAGYSLRQQNNMLEYIDHLYNPDGYLLYSGINDFASYCRKGNITTDKKSYRLPQLSTPSWLLTTNLILKNTMKLRPKAISSNDMISADDIDLSSFRHSFENILISAKKKNKPVLVVTNTKAYRRDQPFAQQQSLSETARFYNSCFDVASLHQLYDSHNMAIIELANIFRNPVLELDKLIPGGKKYFVDATHFSYEGEQFFADALADKIINEKIFNGLFQ